jgi:acetyl esterase/lipase
VEVPAAASVVSPKSPRAPGRPAWIDVGELDALRDESIDYARRVLAAGVAVDLHVSPGCFHASEVFVPDAAS